MENSELQFIREQIKLLENRITRLETLIDGSAKGKPGRKSKLSLEQKNEIIQKHDKEKTSYSVLAEEYQVSKTTISNICRGYEKQRDLIISPIRKNRR